MSMIIESLSLSSNWNNNGKGLVGDDCSEISGGSRISRKVAPTSQGGSNSTHMFRKICMSKQKNW